ncbi:hypothetical protein [Mesobacillus harenae]|uniref:hypothetical protein n=1 Tax=Mesobacillus harenae TaxID=2213203 RepID=UPI001580A28A|nr:hypothetical protein [Mesobacillus harenae]
MIVLYSLLFFIYFINLIINSSALSYITGVLAFLAFFFSIKGSSRLFQIISIIFIVVGFSIFFGQQRSLTELPLYMVSTIPLLAVFFVLPFINSIIIVGRYDQQVNKLLKVKIHHLGQLYGRTSLVSFLLGGFLNIATLPLVKTVVQRNLIDRTEQLKNKFIAQAMLRGYVLSLVISPMELLVILSIEHTDVSYLRILPWLFFITFLILTFDWIRGSRTFKQFKLEDGEEFKTRSQELNAALNKRMKRKIFSLVFYLLLFMISIISFNQLFDIGFLQTIAIIIIPFSFIWAQTIKRIKSYIEYSIPLWKLRTLNLRDNMILFLAVGFFTSNLSDSIFMRYIQEPFALLSGSPILLFVSIQLLFLGLAMIGFHPLVTMSILGAIIDPILLVINPLSVAIVLITSGLSTVVSGPFNISVSLTANLLNINSYKISYWNVGFAFLFSSVGTILALYLL